MKLIHHQNENLNDWFAPEFRVLAFILSAALLLGLGGMLSILGDDVPAKEPGEKPKHEQRAQIHEHHVAVLGVMVEEMHPALASQLPETVLEGQGVMVAGVSDNSPADKAEIQQHDILMTYDDQKLFNPDQLSKLVRTDTPGREVNIGLIRAGKSESVKIKLGDQVVMDRGGRHRIPHTTARPPMFPEWMNRMFREREQPRWNIFDSMTLKKIGDDQFSAAVEHTDQNGKLQKHKYEGTREAIREQIESDKDLSDAQRGHLLQTLGFGPHELREEDFLQPDF